MDENELKEYQEELSKLYKNIEEQENKIWEKIKEVLSDKQVEEIKCYMSDNISHTYDLEIVDNAGIGKKQEEPDYDFRYIFIDQRCGCCEDDYYGTVWVPLPNGKYFKFKYEC